MRPPPPPRPGWLVADVAGHPCEIHAPADPLPGRAVIHLHDLDERWLQETDPLRDLLEGARLPVIAPRAGRSWWLDRAVPPFDASLTPERHVVDHIVAEIGRRFAVAPPGIALTGVGMGGQGALRLAYRHPAVFPVVAAIGPAIDYHTAMRDAHDLADGELFDALWQTYGDVERARQDTAILHVHPLNWPRHQYFASHPDDDRWHDGAVRLQSKLGALGIPHVARLSARPGTTRVADDSLAAADLVGFILERLEQESRRLA